MGLYSLNKSKLDLCQTRNISEVRRVMRNEYRAVSEELEKTNITSQDV